MLLSLMAEEEKTNPPIYNRKKRHHTIETDEKISAATTRRDCKTDASIAPREIALNHTCVVRKKY